MWLVNFGFADACGCLMRMGKQGAPTTLALIRWMEESGMLPGWLREWPWAEWEPGWAMEMSPEVQAEMVRIEDVVEAFLRTKTKGEIYREGMRRRMLVAPVATVEDVTRDPQLAAREYFRPLPDETLRRT